MTLLKTSLARVVLRLAGTAFAGAAMALSFAAGPVQADDLYNWQPVKIGAGGFVTGFVTHPKNASVRYCRSDVGNAYRWDSGAGQWVPMVVHNQTGATGMPASAAPAPVASGVESIAVDPQNTGTVYMAFKSGFSNDVASQYSVVKGSVFKSTDGGQSFTGSDLSVDMNPNSNWRAQGERMAVDPYNPSIVYYGSNDNGLWRSTNGGLNWSQVTSGGAPDSSKVIIGVRFDGASGTTGNFGVSVARIAYALTLDGGVYQTTNGGSNWSDIASGTSLEGAAANSTISPDGSLWAVQDGSDTVWHYSGGNWSSTSVDFAYGQNVTGVTVDPGNTSRVWAVGTGGALSRTDNAGGSWNPSGSTLAYANTLGWLPQSPLGYRSNGGIVYDKNGVLWLPEGNEGVLTYTPTNTETSTNGARWTIQSQGIEEFVTHDVILPPGGKPVVAVEDGTGFVISDPTQFTATQIPLQDQLISNGTGLAYCPNDSSYLAVATADVNGTGSGNNYSGYSTNGGASWQRFASYPVDSNGNSLKQAGSLAVSRRNGWGAGSDHLVWVPTASQPESWSNDGGNSWHQGNGFPTTSAYWTFSLKQRALKADPFVADKFYYVATWSGGCYVSTDGGQNWAKQSGSTLPTATHHGQLETNRAVQNDLWFVDGWEGASAHGLWHSTDGGVTFNNSGQFDYAITLALGKGSGNAGDQAYSVYVYGRLAGDANWGIFRSNDGGGSWVRVAYYPAGIFDQPTSLAASWDTYGLVYVGFNGNSFVYGTVTGTGGGGGGTGGGGTDTAVYNFETSLQGWNSSSANCTVATSSAQKYAGSQSLAVNVNTSATDTAYTRVVNTGAATPMPSAGQTVTYHVWVPAGSLVTSAAPYSQDANWLWASTPGQSLSAGQWNTVTLTVPTSAVTPLNALGVTLSTSGAWSGTCYVDAVNFATSSGSGNLITGTTFDDGAGPWGNNTANAASAAYDGSVTTFYDCVSASGGYTGIDTGTATTVSSIKYAPRAGEESRMVGGVFEGSTTSATSGYHTLATVTATPADGLGNTLTVSDTTAYRWLRYRGPDNGYCNVAEIQFVDPPAGAPGTPSGLTAAPAAAGTKKISLKWTAASGASTYHILRSTQSGYTGTKAQAVNVTGTSYTDSGLTVGTTYYYTVTAANSHGQSARSAQAAAKAP